MQLSVAQVVVRNPKWRSKSGKSNSTREGFVDGGGQVFLPPKDAKKVKAWKKEMEGRGYQFGGAK